MFSSRHGITNPIMNEHFADPNQSKAQEFEEEKEEEGRMKKILTAIQMIATTVAYPPRMS